MHQDIVARMGDVELLAELRQIESRAGRRGDVPTAQRARRLFAVFYGCRLRRDVPDAVWTDTRAFVRQYAG